jgi:hypothetical protein
MVARTGMGAAFLEFIGAWYPGCETSSKSGRYGSMEAYLASQVARVNTVVVEVEVFLAPMDQHQTQGATGRVYCGLHRDLNAYLSLQRVTAERQLPYQVGRCCIVSLLE